LTTTILTIDDSSTIRRSVGIALKKFHFKVIEAEDGPRGLEQAAIARPDLILLDINMTLDMNGFDVLKKLKSDEKTRSIPVIMLTSVGEGPEVVKAVRLGAVDYMVKPFQPEQLAQKIFRLVEGQRAAASPPSPSSLPASASPDFAALAARATGLAEAEAISPADGDETWKALIIICPASLRDELAEVLDDSYGVTEYLEASSCRIETALAFAAGRVAADSLLIAAIPEIKCREFCDRLGAWKDASGLRHAVRVLVLPVETRL
jgi:CheY-like chemotaxis protein